MNIQRFLFFVCLLPLFLTAHAQDAVKADYATFLGYTRDLKTAGNRHYLLSNRRGIREVVDSLTAAIQQRQQLGLLTAEQVDSFMADVYKLEGDYHYENSLYDPSSMTTSEDFFKKALAYREAHPVEATHELFILHQELAQLYYLQERYPDALQSMLAAQRYYDAADSREHIIYPALLALCYARNNQFEEALETIGFAEEECGSSQDETYAEVLRKKAKVLMLRQEAQGGKADEALDCYRRYFELQRRYASEHFLQMNAREREQYWMALRPFVTDCYRLEAADPALLYDVTLFAKGLLLQLGRVVGEGRATAEAVASLSYTWQQIQQRLQKDAAAIEFIQYEKGGQQRMGALLLQAKGKPEFIALTRPDSILAHECGSWTVAERLSTTNGSRKNALYQDSALIAMVWPQALISRITNRRQIYFAPDSYQHQLAIEYMFPAPERGTQPALLRLTSTRQLMAEAPSTKDACALVCGGVRYNNEAAMAATAATADNDAQTYSYMQRMRANFSYLEGSRTEADTIASLSQGRCGQLLVDSAVTEPLFRQLCGRYPLVFLSTHGYCCAAAQALGTDLKPGAMTDESLSESLVALAGANTHLLDEQFDSSRPDGLLSAREMSSLDMSRVQLFVASACQTALGRITPDGVYGIQRGLKNAGVGAIVVSLWSVDDYATCALMTHFYQGIIDGKPLRRAFDDARAYLLSTNSDLQQAGEPHVRDISNPQFANAFILIDATM
jgi:CHAT domain-containing protein